MSGREGPGIIFGIRGCCNTRIPHLQLKQAEAGEREAGGKQSLDHRQPTLLTLSADEQDGAGQRGQELRGGKDIILAI